jgi:hypothetical protein
MKSSLSEKQALFAATGGLEALPVTMKFFQQDSTIQQSGCLVLKNVASSAQRQVCLERSSMSLGPFCALNLFRMVFSVLIWL